MEEMRANVEYGSTGSEEPQAQDLARQAREQVQQIGQKVATAATQAKDY
ncbi:MAG: hypothetical protein IRZ19_13955, partial [Pyrinomonas methylaliphatogenes]|nr:hypothetical protein [Pyrinomonas methylaliphatogenes]